MRRLPIAREGWPFIVVPAAIAGLLAATGRPRLAAPFAAAALASAGFFRDPEREVSAGPGAVLAPADGRVIAVEEAEDAFVGLAIRVAIFLSPFDVHINRAPIAGRVVGAAWSPGRFVAAYRHDAAELNERCTVNLAGDSARVAVVQIAGVVARRIVCRVAPGDKLAAGQRFGLIRFGSRTDCLMPRGARATVRPGDRVTGGVTVIGVLR